MSLGIGWQIPADCGALYTYQTLSMEDEVKGVEVHRSFFFFPQSALTLVLDPGHAFMPSPRLARARASCLLCSVDNVHYVISLSLCVCVSACLFLCVKIYTTCVIVSSGILFLDMFSTDVCPFVGNHRGW